MEEVKIALNKLEQDKINNISIINFIKNNRLLSVDIVGNSVLIRGKSDRVWIYISSNNKDELNNIKTKLSNDDVNFGATDDWMVPIIAKERKIIWDIPVLKFYLPNDKSLPPVKYTASPLTIEDSQTIYNNYNLKEYVSKKYIIERIQKGISAGIFEDNKLVSWGITQDDGAIGFLHTLDNYRRKGYGINVVLSMIYKLLQQGELPFAYIEPSNKNSINLFLKLGFKENKKVHWFQLK
ncbi:MAG: GNAT family N-acetyltransferase [Ignavibacteriaceae bacterium]